LADATAIERAVGILRAGGLVAFPTETVYGLGADARSAHAVRKIFATKGRPADHPVIVHLASIDEVAQWAREAPQAAQRLMRHFWPGPLTLILQRAACVIDEVTGGQDTVGLRVPSHPLAQTLLRAFGGGIAAPSANRFGRISPTTAAHVHEELGDAVDLVLDGGACDVGIESTIVDFSTGTPRLLRPGGIAVNELEAVMQSAVGRADAHSPRASGTLLAHYAPAARMLLVAPDELEQTLGKYAREMDTVAVVARRAAPRGGIAGRWHVAATDAQGYAHDLYATLRTLDRAGFRLLLVESPPQGPEWEAVRDRLQRAATGSGRLDAQSDLSDDVP
jgi:L-threonylcarbamoyladenylate synthase